MDSLVIKLLIMVIAALVVTGIIIYQEWRTQQGSRKTYALQGILGVFLIGILISLLIVR
ncbi:hypothetical protein ACFQ5J_07385 [Lacticaseibacillus baoqingensis]|uniref:DUF3976 domain-containing protein n=1 Tax=Lacticaseibacillus baoqingensis TaxID=2486013 RepID=A0ABW4E8X1_9LACO|nr:hypothetical protein [Lacticaseibacillus baoqingensis]